MKEHTEKQCWRAIRTSQRRFRNSRKACPSHVDTMAADIWSLPEEVLLHIFQGMHIKDLLSLRSSHPYFCDLINTHPTIWSQITFQDTWPSVPNMKHFTKAAKHKNFEALVKLAVAFLYNEGLPGDFEGQKITTNGERAAEMFCQVEGMLPSASPFSWLFIRPPWAVAGACCKECVFNNMKAFVQHSPDPSIHICIAKTMEVLDMDSNRVGITEHLQKAAALGSKEAAYLLWTVKYHTCSRPMLDCAEELQRIRDLRQIACPSYPTAQLALCTAYMTGHYGGYSQDQAAAYVRSFVQSSEPSHIKNIYRLNELTHSMRYILVDWLVEVACMKDFSSLTLHMAVSVVDRYLQRHKTTRSMLQLLGVASMVLCSRFLGKEIITIREAAWLTDNTYKYEDVVRMMGEITATLKGKLGVITGLDYVRLLNLAAESDQMTCLLAEYYCELALLQSDLSSLPQAELAAACVHLARLTRLQDSTWPGHMVEFTGFTLQEMIKPTVLLHEKCFLERAMVDHRDVVLQAVKERYADEEFSSVSNIPVLSKDALHGYFGITTSPEMPKSVVQPEKLCREPERCCCPDPKDLIASPCRPGSNRKRTKSAELDLDREQAATPSMENMVDSSICYKNSTNLNESMVSGYDGDREDEGESFAEFDGYDSDPDLESLWCVDTVSVHMGNTANSSFVETSSGVSSDDSFLGIPSQTSLNSLPSIPKFTDETCVQQINFCLTSVVPVQFSSPDGDSGCSKSQAKPCPPDISSPAVAAATGSHTQSSPVLPPSANLLNSSHVTHRMRIHIYKDAESAPSGRDAPTTSARYAATVQPREARPRGLRNSTASAFTTSLASNGQGRFALQTLSTCNQTRTSNGKLTAAIKRKSKQDGPVAAKVKAISSK